MKFTVNSQELTTRLANLTRAQASKPVLPILECILFEVKDGELTLVANDSELALEAKLPVYDSEDGQVAIGSKQLLAAIKEISDRPITFDIDDETYSVDIDYTSGRYRVVGMNGEEFPRPLVPTGSTGVDIDSSIIEAGIGMTVGATADDELRPQMNGIYLDDTPTGFVLVASDGHKLCKYTRHGTTRGMRSFIMPKKAAKVLQKILKGDFQLHFTIGESTFRIENIGGYTLTGRIVEGRYPNYQSVIPEGYTQSAYFNRMDAIGALRRVGVFADAMSNLVKIQVTDADKMIISAQNLDFSTSAEETINADCRGGAIAIGAHLGFLSEELGVIKSEMVEMKYGDPSQAIVILPVQNEDTEEEFIQLLMPMMLKD